MPQPVQAEGGFILIYRTLTDNPVFRDEPEAWAFASLVLRAAWKPTRVRYKERVVVLERGQLTISVRDFAKRWGRTKDWAQRFLDRLEDAQMVRRKRDSTETGDATAPNVITICNYEKYQDRSVIAATATKQQPRQQRDSAATQNKEEKEGKEGIKSSSVSPSFFDQPANTNGKVRRWREGDPVPDEWVEWAVTNMKWRRQAAISEAKKMIDAALAHGRGYSDWMAAWRNWCRSDLQKTKATTAGMGPA
jgi:hypothetical protein